MAHRQLPRSIGFLKEESISNGKGWDGVNLFAEPFFTEVYKRSSGIALVAI